MGRVGWKSNEQAAQEALEAAREAERAAIAEELRATDHTQLPDYGTGRQGWAQYRQAVRDRLGEIDGLETAEQVRAHPWPDVPAQDWGHGRGNR